MTNSPVGAETLAALGGVEQCVEAYPSRDVAMGPLTVARALPVKGRRLIGPWCFLDRFGPLAFAGGVPMDVASHPHIGLQTVTWLLEGEVVHYDSLGYEALLRPGGVNVMTAGGAIAHAERTPPDNSGRLSGVQLWTALPDAHRHGAPAFQHVAEVPVLEPRGGIVRVFSGAVDGVASPSTHFSDVLGADLQVHGGEGLTVPLQPRYEHGVLILDGDCTLEGQQLEPRVLYYLGTRRHEVAVTSRGGARLLLVGGTPFPEQILMWWNFVARTPEEIRQARADWEERRRFGDVPRYGAARIPAPDLVRFARPNPVS